MTKRAQTTNEKRLDREWLRHVAACDCDELLDELKTSRQGLTPEGIEESLETWGPNEVFVSQRDSLPIRFIKSFADPFVAILLLVAAVSLATDVIFVAPGQADPATPIIICVMVLISGVLRFVQESRSGDAAEALVETIETTCNVERKGVGRKEMPLDEIVVGDIIHLSAGDMVPADLRIIAARDLFVGQSALTGESEAQEKHADAETDPSLSLTEMDCLAFLGTTVISGTGIGVVAATGANTFFGSISRGATAKRRSTSYEQGIGEVSRLLLRLMLIMAPTVFIVNGITKGDWLQSLLFAFSVAVGLTPEMLPMIVKTGTLTEDSIALERHLDVLGREDVQVLAYAFLNSFFETGLRNLIDSAIIKRAHEESAKGIEDIDVDALVADNYLVDELPFDFERRRVSVVVGNAAGARRMITKGALEEILELCNRVEYDGAVTELDDTLIDEVTAGGVKLADEGMRVLGVAIKDNPEGVDELDNDDERDMVFVGYLAFLDPPKPSAGAAVAALAAHGVTTKVLTGDSTRVARHVCNSIGIAVEGELEGAQIERMSDEELDRAVETTTLYSKLSPDQKVRVVECLRAQGHVVGFMGDGVNDAPAMRASDCGISVDSAVDIAKESADIILLEKDLGVLERGLENGRGTFSNMSTYVKLTAAANFGNIFSMLAASAFLPFLPMLPVQLLLLNLINDVVCTSIPWDNVEKSRIDEPRSWDSKSVASFMRWFGPISSVLDIVTFLVLFFVVCPAAFGPWESVVGTDAELLFEGTFQAGWFLESIITQLIAIFLLRTDAFSRDCPAALPLVTLSLAGAAFAALLSFSQVGALVDFAIPPFAWIGWLAAILAAYSAIVLLAKHFYIRRHGSLV